MATSTQAKNFINEIAPCAQNSFKKMGKVLPSVCIGMACIESGYGTTAIMRRYNAYLGQKVGTGKTATKYWSGKFFSSRTKEEYTVGKHTVITSAFRAYDNMQQCTDNYYELLNTNLYKKVQSGSPYQTQMQQIKACGYMTSSTEVNSVINVIQKFNLTRFDVVNANPIDDITDILIDNPTLRLGDRNEYVKAWQIYLNMHGYDVGKAGADGIFGKDTEKAVYKYQKDHPECGKPDGIIGPKTWASIK